MVIYIALQAIYLYCYFRAISIADISFVAPLMTLFSVANMVGAYIILGQIPTITGVIGAGFIVAGSWFIARSKQYDSESSAEAHRKASILVITAIIVCSIFANIEVIMLRMSNPTTYNFYTSILTVPFVIFVTVLIIKSRRRNTRVYWTSVSKSIKNNLWPLSIVGLTYTVNMLATYQAKITAPNQAYVGSIKAASVLPVVILGVLFFNEKVSSKQWAGISAILIGLVLISVNV